MIAITCKDCGRFATIVLIAWALILSGCSKSETESKSAGSGTSTASAKPVEVRIGYFANVTHAQAVIGIDTGAFAKALAPNTVTTKVFNAGPSLVEALFAGEIDIGYVGPGPALSAFEKSKGQGIMVLAGAAANGVTIVARADSGIHTMADLAGKRIATPQLGNTQDIAAKHYLMFELKQTQTDNVIAVPNAEQAAMMSRGQIDAAWAPEPWGARLVAEAGGQIIAEEKDLWPSKEFVLTVVVGNPEFVAKHPDIVEHLLKAHCELTAKLQADAKGELPALAKGLENLTGKQMDAAVLEKAISRVKFIDAPLPETFATMSQWALDLGFAKSKPDMAKLIDTKILDRAKAGGTSKAGQ